MVNKGGTIALKRKGERKMTELICPKCRNVTHAGIIKVECAGNVQMWGIIQCLTCQHEFPFTMHKNYMEKLDTALPGGQSGSLNPLVPEDIKDDVREAERANYSQCYKASVSMCRRALQLSLIDKGIEDKQLSTMLKEAKRSNKLTDNTYNMAKSIKGYGDIGVHRTEKLEPKEVEIVIYMAVKMLNELFI